MTAPAPPAPPALPAPGASDATQDARGISVNLMTLLAQAAMPAFHVQLARLLGAGGYGLYTWSNSFVEMFSVVTLFGMDQAVSRQVSLAHARGDARAAVEATGTALRVVMLSGALVGLGVFVAAPAVAALQGKPGLVGPLRMLALVPVFYHGTTVFLVATQARRVMKYDFWTRGIAQPLLLLALTTLALRSGGGVAAAGGAVAAGMGVTFALAAVFYGRELPLGQTLAAALRGPVDRALVRHAVPLLGANLVWALQGRIDAFALGHYRGSAEMGAYAAGLLYVASISQVRGAFDPVVRALIPAALERGDAAGLTATIQRQTRWVALVAMPLAVLFGGFGDALLAVFGHDFTRGALAMAVLAVGHLVNALALAAWVVPMSRHVGYSTAVAAGCVALQAVLLPILTPRFGLTGAAISAASALALGQVAQMTLAWRLTRVHGLSVGLLKVAAAALAALVLGRLVFHWAAGALALRFVAGVGSAAAVYLGVVAALGLEAEERAAVRRVFARLRLRRG